MLPDGKRVAEDAPSGVGRDAVDGVATDFRELTELREAPVVHLVGLFGLLGAGIGEVDHESVERQWPRRETARRHPAIDGFFLLLLAEVSEARERIEALVGATAEQLGVSAFEDLHGKTLQKRKECGEKREMHHRSLSREELRRAGLMGLPEQRWDRTARRTTTTA